MSLGLPTAPGGYRWWYLDAASDDGRDHLVCIFFWGSVFSPRYAARLRRGEAALPGEHAAVHLAFQRDGVMRHWLLAERSDAALESEDSYRVGASRWESGPGRVRIALDERTLGQRTRGTLELEALEAPLTEAPLALTPGVADHRWHAVMPRVRVKVALDEPGVRFEGRGYHDANAGSEPMERAIRGWSWARHSGGPKTRVAYDLLARDGQRFRHTLVGGAPPRLECSRATTLGFTRRTGWGIALPEALAWEDERPTRTGSLLLSAPFYARYLIEDGGLPVGTGETLDLDRFEQPLVRWMLRFRTWQGRGASTVAPSAALGAGR